MEQALRVAPMDANDKDRNLVATLYVNRASVLQVSLVSLTISVCRSVCGLHKIELPHNSVEIKNHESL